MKKAVLAAVLAVVAGTAAAQIVEHNRSNSQTNERQSSYIDSMSINKTMSIGTLFFPRLAEFEKALWDGFKQPERLKDLNDLAKPLAERQFMFLRKKIEEGKMQKIDERIKIMRCNVFSTNGRVVWSHKQEAMTSNYENGVVSFNEPLIIVRSGESYSFNEYSKSLFGEPVPAADFIRCSAFYANLIEAAIDKMQKKGALVKSNKISMRNLESESEKALWDSFYTLRDWSIYSALPEDPTCSVTSGEGMRTGGLKDFRCGEWTVSQNPLRAAKAGITILDQNTINGRTWEFTESTSSANSNSNKRTNTRGTNQRANVAN